MKLQSEENGKTVEHILLGMKCKVSWLYSTRVIKIYLLNRTQIYTKFLNFTDHYLCFYSFPQKILLGEYIL